MPDKGWIRHTTKRFRDQTPSSCCSARGRRRARRSANSRAEPRMQPNPAAGRSPDVTVTTVGRSVTREPLGQCGTGEAYRADDVDLKRRVALKRIGWARRADERSRKRLWHEAQLASQLTDPHIAAVYDVFEEGDELFIVMEYVEGQTLRRRLGRPLQMQEFLSIAPQCVAGLVAAHRAGILHGDIKPENIMLTSSGRVKILDFGVTHRSAGSESSTTLDTLADGKFAGTVPYMSPEVLEAKESDARADIFSLGVVFYEALAGRNPFHAEGFLLTCQRILHEEPAPLRGVNSAVPAELERIVSKMLAKDSDQRYPSAVDLGVDLEAFRRASVFAHSPALRHDAVQPRPRRRLFIGAALGALVCIAVAGALAYRHFRAPLLTQHASILLADFENLTGEKLFDQTVTEAMRQALRQSRYFRLVPQDQVLEAEERMGRKNVSHVDAAFAREICQREGYAAFLTGEISSANNGYSVRVRIVNPLEGITVFTETEALSSTTDLYAAVDSLAKTLRKRLGESLAQVDQSSQPLAKVTTPSLLALQR